MDITFTLFSIDDDLVDQWQQSFFALVPEELRNRVSFVHESFNALNATFDCIVSPANSFGRFDGGFDQILTETFAPADDQQALTRAAQAVLYDRWRGYAPPGTCTLVPLPGTPCFPNSLGCRYIALCPTMRFPTNVSWHQEIVYNCVWSLLVELDRHNARAGDDLSVERIASVGMTGLATGVGAVPAAVCGRQTALAFRHFEDAKAHPDEWTSLKWGDIFEMPLNVRLPMDG